MRPSLAQLSKASRFTLTSKHGNKDYYKGNRTSAPPGVGFRTGPPGRHIVKGKGKYVIDDEKVRIFIGPGFQEEGKATFLRADLRPFVHLATDPDGGWSRGLPGKVENREEWYNQMASWIGNETPEQTDIRETEQARRFAEEQDRESKAAASEAEGGDKKVDA